MKIGDVVSGTQHKFTVQKYNDELGRSYLKIDMYLCKAVNAEKIVHLRTGHLRRVYQSKC